MIKTTMRSYCKNCIKAVELKSDELILENGTKEMYYYCGECHVHIRTIKVER